MIRISRITDYGIVLMAHLAARGEQSPCNAREVAEATQLPLPMVSKILKCLAREGLLVSHRGAKGGYGLARSPAQIRVTEMIGALEGPFGLTECAMHPGACAQESSCHVREPWQRINHAVHDALARITLADLVGPRPGAIVPLESLGVRTTHLDTQRGT
ncbi:MAG: SUF system Fe-S cluster assembly regulator [Myxococcales bacterium]|nr:SUF system Fe-S cluster assembly regulator [Myxococcales bacterium]MDH5307315.1 SUF system Fe-S cluster assembly regulator [Myxococcales bacterium]MDH5565389.1 SUF system Fe-S cluster assembly regulator [Myxococcales bacterium]